MEMVNVGLDILQRYGILGFTTIAVVVIMILAVLGVGWLIYKTYNHFICQVNKFHSTIKEMTAQMFTMAESFAGTVKESSLSQKELAKATDNVVRGFDRMAEQNRQEHSKIVDVLYSRKAINGS